MSSKYVLSNEDADDIIARFFCNTNDMDILDFGIALENALYYFHRKDKKLSVSNASKHCPEFGAALFSMYPEFQHLVPMIPKIYKLHTKHQSEINTCGVICLNEDMTHMLCVVHSIAPRLFSFPKGKMMEGESPIVTATRETLEEATVDVSEFISQKDSFRYKRKGRADGIMFYAIGLPMKQYHTERPKEIHRILWIPVDDYESTNLNPDPPTKSILVSHVLPYIKAHKKSLK